jgi:prepilin peptidase CpaA
MLDVLPLIAAMVVFALGAMTDIVSYRIPNWISLAAVALYAVTALLGGISLAEIGWHFALGFGALVIGFALFTAGMIGGGDAKFFAAGALWVGPAFFLKYCMVFALIGGALAALLIVLRRPAIARPLARLTLVRPLLNPKAGMPYGVALGLGALIVLPATPLFLTSFHT